MQRNTFIVLLVLALGLGAWVYFYEIEGEEQRQTEADAEKQLFQLKPEELTELTIGNAHGTFSFTRSASSTPSAGGDAAAAANAPQPATPQPAAPQPATQQPGAAPDWQLTVPMTAPADSRAVEDVAYALNALRILRTVDEAPKDLSPFGLSTPTYSITFTSKAGKGTLKVGDEAPFGAGRYIQKEGDPKVYLTAYPLKDRLDKDLVGWRNKKVLSFSLPDVTALSIGASAVPGAEYPGLDLKKEGDRWTAQQAPGVSLDSAAIDAILYELQGMNALGFTGQTDPALYGLSTPVLTIQVATTDGKQQTVAFGPEYGEEKRLPVVGQPGAEILLVDGAVLSKLKKTALELRDTRVIDVKRFSLTRLEATVDGKSLVAERKDDAWTLSGPLAEKVKPADVDAILDDLVGLRAESFVESAAGTLAQYGLDKPGVTLKLTEAAEGKDPAVTRVVSLGNGGDVASPSVYVQVDAKGTIMKVNNYVLEDIRDVLLKEKKPEAVAPPAPGAGLELNPPDPFLKEPPGNAQPSNP